MSLLLATSGDIASSEVLAEGVDFDGTYDYLSRSSDLVGNVDSKTFTFSAWVYIPSNISVTGSIWSNQWNWLTFDLGYKNFFLQLYDSSYTSIMQMHIPTGGSNTGMYYNTWNHLLISINMGNQSNCKVYVNDVLSTVSYSTFVTGSTPFFTAAN